MVAHPRDGTRWFSRVLRALGRPSASSPRRPRAPELYAKFREILARNDDTLEILAHLEDTLSGRLPLALDVMCERLRHAMQNVQSMVDHLQQISGRQQGLQRALDAITEEITAQLPPRQRTFGPLVLPLRGLRAKNDGLVGGKMANLAEAWWGGVGVELPEGFVITTAAFARFMAHNALWERVDEFEHSYRTLGLGALQRAAGDLAEAFAAAEVPEDVARAILAAYAELADGEAAIRVALRSSAVGEDHAASHAGLYRTELDVDEDRLLTAYRVVLASAYSPAAVIYRANNDMSAWDATMAVGCMRMVPARCSGVVFSRDFEQPAADRALIAVVPGLGAGLVDGTREALEVVVTGDSCALPPTACIGHGEVSQVVRTARVVEDHFGAPVDVEWALAEDGALFVLQARPITGIVAEDTQEALADGLSPLLQGGRVACPGIASGPVVRFIDEGAVDTVTPGSVVVTRHSMPKLALVLNRIAALVTEVGSPIGHMAILAREFQVPCIVGLAGALQELVEGQRVTVDAGRCRVLAGEIEVPRRVSRPSESSSVVAKRRLTDAELLRRVAQFVTPLNLTDPTRADFSPDHCQTLHDVTRYVHEQLFEVMFQVSDRAELDGERAVRLQDRLPFVLLVHDLGGGFAPVRAEEGGVSRAEITSPPMLAFLAGLLDERIRWDQPRPLSPRGFISVVGANLSGPPAHAQQLGRTSYAVVSDRYLNFSTKAGYHFSTVDTYCGRSQNKNYIHFRFSGGAAGPERRARRIRFLTIVLDQLGFRTRQRGDALVARLDKTDQETIGQQLVRIGQLVMVTRQLDMLMDDDGSPDFFAAAFLEERLETF